ncbi:MAG: sirohydrochlorin cobaltochelatase [Bacteroides sp.]|nr:sirohydrochlorin cobaltochelatase [Bacteroides sp.]MBD5308622.1 sirohydrochlorin cobaltochelatase [Bacteroides sp.]
MRYLLPLILLLLSALPAGATGFGDRPGEKTAILMVHFGTTYDDTRATTIDALNDRVRTAFPDTDVFEAYTSRIIISRLRKRGISKPTPQEALLRLAADGYTHVVVQGSNVIDGIEAEVLRGEASLMAPFFKEIRVGRPLLYSVDDCQNVVSILRDRFAPRTARNGAVVLIGHGTSTPATAIYSQIDYMFTAAGAPAFHVATVEGYPDYETTLAKLKASRAKNVTLVPFMLVAGDHARNDIGGEWRENLESEGFSVTPLLESLGSIPGIREIYIDHIRAALQAPVLDAAATKAATINATL